MSEPYSVRVDSHDGTTTIRLGGEIDLVAGRSVRNAVADSILGDRPDRLVIDLTDTTFLGSTGVNALVLAHHAAHFVGAVLEVTPGPPNVMWVVLEISGLERFLNVRPAPQTLMSTG
jgi:stage II sporulation protein AA (anti-sigma F factor antagonist)